VVDSRISIVFWFGAARPVSWNGMWLVDRRGGRRREALVDEDVVDVLWEKTKKDGETRWNRHCC
jgi:hypothetical protein